MMMTFDLVVTFRDGSTVDASADQYAISVWERWAAKNGLRPSITDPAPLAWTQLRVMAWAAVQRDATSKVTFEQWDATVLEVSNTRDRESDPTLPAMSAG